MAAGTPFFRATVIGGLRFQLVNWGHPDVEARVLREMAGGLDVYYDRDWPLTFRFCEFLVARPELLRERRVLVVAAGVGPEAVVAGTHGEELWVNDLSPAALELLALQLRQNGLEDFRSIPGSFDEIPVTSGVDLVIASFAIYDAATAGAMIRLLGRTHGAGIPVLLANQEIGGYLAKVLHAAPGPRHELHREEEMRVILFGPPLEPTTPP